MHDSIGIQRENPSQAINPQRTIEYDGNSDLDPGNTAVLLPHNGLDRDGLFRAPIGFPRPLPNGRGSRGRVPSEGFQQRSSPERNRRHGDKADRCVICERNDMGCAKKGCYLFGDTPKVSYVPSIIIGGVILTFIMAGLLLVWAVRNGW
jgi:hypothetical protein